MQHLVKETKDGLVLSRLLGNGVVHVICKVQSGPVSEVSEDA